MGRAWEHRLFVKLVCDFVHVKFIGTGERTVQVEPMNFAEYARLYTVQVTVTQPIFYYERYEHKMKI